jgi:hypothetical protein
MDLKMSWTPRAEAGMPERPELDALIKASIAKTNAMTQEERDAMRTEQRKSWVRGEMLWEHPELSRQTIHALVEEAAAGEMAREQPSHAPYRMPPANLHLRRAAYEEMRLSFLNEAMRGFFRRSSYNKIIRKYLTDRGWVGG